MAGSAFGAGRRLEQAAASNGDGAGLSPRAGSAAGRMLTAERWELWDPSCRGDGWDEHPSPEDTAPESLLAGTGRPGWGAFKLNWKKPFLLSNEGLRERCGSVIILV